MNLGHMLVATLFVAVMLTIIDKTKEEIKQRKIDKEEERKAREWADTPQ